MIWILIASLSFSQFKETNRRHSYHDLYMLMTKWQCDKIDLYWQIVISHHLHCLGSNNVSNWGIISGYPKHQEGPTSCLSKKNTGFHNNSLLIILLHEVSFDYQKTCIQESCSSALY